MNKTEALQILAILKAAYPNSYKGMTKPEALGTAAVWALQFHNLPVDIVLMAVNKAISASKFPPSISEVREKVGRLYWEAWDAIQSWQQERMLELPHESYRDPDKVRDCISRVSPPPAVELYIRVRDLTEKYRNPGAAEPELTEMLPMMDQMQISPIRLEGGEDS